MLLREMEQNLACNGAPSELKKWCKLISCRSMRWSLGWDKECRMKVAFFAVSSGTIADFCQCQPMLGIWNDFGNPILEDWMMNLYCPSMCYWILISYRTQGVAPRRSWGRCCGPSLIPTSRHVDLHYVKWHFLENRFRYAAYRDNTSQSMHWFAAYFSYLNVFACTA